MRTVKGVAVDAGADIRNKDIVYSFVGCGRAEFYSFASVSSIDVDYCLHGLFCHCGEQYFAVFLDVPCKRSQAHVPSRSNQRTVREIFLSSVAEFVFKCLRIRRESASCHSFSHVDCDGTTQVLEELCSTRSRLADFKGSHEC